MSFSLLTVNYTEVVVLTALEGVQSVIDPADDMYSDASLEDDVIVLNHRVSQFLSFTIIIQSGLIFELELHLASDDREI